MLATIEITTKLWREDNLDVEHWRTACPAGQIQTQILTLNKPQVQSAFFLILKTLKLSSKSKQRSSFPDWKLKLVSMNMNMYFLTVSF